MQEITAPLATLPDDALPQVSDVDFPVVLRGYDRIAVDAFVRKTSQLVAELQATRSPEAAVRRALERVGEEVSGILQRAHDTAERITATSRREAEDRLEAARAEAAQITAAAEGRVKDLDAETDRIWAERHRIVEDTRELARQLVGLAESASERFPGEEVAPQPRDDDATAATSVFATALRADDEDETHAAFRAPAEPGAPGEDLDWGAAGEWRAETPELTEPPEYVEPGEGAQATPDDDDQQIPGQQQLPSEPADSAEPDASGGAR
jgi:DivIVA domain-containing protein